jgi:hypothetical protein
MMSNMFLLRSMTCEEWFPLLIFLIPTPPELSFNCTHLALEKKGGTELSIFYVESEALSRLKDSVF